MTYFIGIDEAGYGPNLGPLVIAASVWELGERTPYPNAEPVEAACPLYDRLRDAVRGAAASDSPPGDNRLLIADSKQVYRPGLGLARLETGVLAAVAACHGAIPQTRRGLISTVAQSEAAADACDAEDDRFLPVEATAGDVLKSADVLVDALRKSDVRLVDARCRTVHAGEFNRLTSQHGSKSTLLTEQSLALLESALGRCGSGPVVAVADKHGGRNHYHAALQRRFAQHVIEIRRESRQESTYRWRDAVRTVEVQFRAGGEAYLATALASMLAKYVRELAMLSFNRFWQRHVPHLRPTAGYPLDARRFRADIALAQRELGISDDQLWRVR